MHASFLSLFHRCYSKFVLPVPLWTTLQKSTGLFLFPNHHHPHQPRAVPSQASAPTWGLIHPQGLLMPNFLGFISHPNPLLRRDTAQWSPAHFCVIIFAVLLHMSSLYHIRFIIY